METSVAAFRGLRYHPDTVDLAKAVAPPYDVIDPAEHVRLFARDPHNIVRLLLGRPGTSDAGSPPPDSRYAEAAREFRAWREAQVLVQETEPAVYGYRQTFTDPSGLSRRRDGFLALRRLVPQGRAVRPHEQTLAGPRADRLKLLAACEANLSPIFCLYAADDLGLAAAAALWDREVGQVDLTDDEGVRHQLWKITGSMAAAIAQALGRLPLLIADGHHRYATALAYQERMRSEGKGEGPWDWVLTYFTNTSSPGFLVWPIHRMLRHLPAAGWREFTTSLRSVFHLVPYRGPRGRLAAVLHQGGETGFRCGLAGPPGQDLTILEAQPPHGMNADLRQLDTAVLGVLLLDKIDPAEIVYEHSLDRVWEALETGKAQAGFILRPPDMRVVERLAAMGTMVPPKTTFFYPKLKSGLVIYAHR